MKQVISILLVLLIFFQAFEKISILVYYQTYQDYIAKYLCENRYNPDSNCNGHCFLMKKMREQDTKRTTPVAPDNQKSDFVFPFSRIKTNTVKEIIELVISAGHIFYYNEFVADFFHPPNN